MASARASRTWQRSSRKQREPKSDEFEQLSLYHATSGGEAALARKALGDDIRGTPQTPSVAVPAE